MSLVQLKNLSVLYGTPPLLDGIEFVLQPKERVCIVGRNGSGKSTMMRVIANEIPFDEGTRVVPNQTKIARLPQDPPESVDISMFDYVAEGLAEAGELLKQYFKQTQVVTTDHS